MIFQELIMRDTRANQPAAASTQPAALYFVTDELVWERNKDDQSAWESVSSVNIPNGSVTEAKQTLADNTTGNVSTSAHGYAPKVVAPSAGIRKILAIDNGETVLKNVDLFDNTDPADTHASVAAPGTSLVAARRDHVHISAPGGGGGAWEFVDKQTVTGSAATDITFSGLDGDVDEVYKIVGRMVGTTTGNDGVALRPNGATTGLGSRSKDAVAGIGGGENDRAYLSLYYNWNIASLIHGFEAILWAKSGTMRAFQSQGSIASAANYGFTHAGGGWTDTGANITSLVVHSQTASSLGVGSEVVLYKLAQA